METRPRVVAAAMMLAGLMGGGNPGVQIVRPGPDQFGVTPERDRPRIASAPVLRSQKKQRIRRRWVTAKVRNRRGW